MRTADRVIAVNPAIAGEMERRYRRRVDSVVLNCPPFEDLSAAPSDTIRDRFDLGPGVPVFLFSGGLSRNRGIKNTVLALRELDEGVLVILGEGALREELERLAAEHGLGGRVLFTDFVPHEDVPGFIRSADVGVIPYENVGVNHYLASPSKLFIYLMAEMPIACSDFPFLRSVVVDNGLGEVFDPGDPSSIACAPPHRSSSRRAIRVIRPTSGGSSAGTRGRRGEAIHGQLPRLTGASA